MKSQKIIETSDGSHTIYVPELDEHYHSVHGAVQESEHIYIRSGYDRINCNPLRIFEVGFGTGLNALLTATRAIHDDREVYYTSLEKYPLGTDILNSLNYHEFAGSSGRKIFDLIHMSPWGTMNLIEGKFHLMKVEADMAGYTPDFPVDLVYFDAFGPDKQPSMWTEEIFSRIAGKMKSGSILVTYSSKGEVKRKLRTAGFEVKLLPGPPGKKEFICAKKN